MLNICSSSWIKTSESCWCIKIVDSNATLYWGPNFWLLHLNSIYEYAFSIWCFSLLEFCCRLLACFYASPIYISWRIISVACMSFFCPQIFLLWLIYFFKGYKLLIYFICIQIHVYDNTIFYLFMYYNLINCLLKFLFIILFSISPRSNSILNKTFTW
jgi:hypothetical protein